MDSAQTLLAEADAAYTRVVLDPVRYARQAQDVVHRARSANHVEALVAGLRAQAWARHAVLDNDGAKLLLDQGVRLAGRHGLPHRLGNLLVARAVALQELGRYEAAARDLRRAEPLVAAAERPDLRLQLAILDHNRGRLRAAARAYRELLDDETCPPVVLIKAANNLAHAQTLLGRPDLALGHLDRAAELASELGPRLAAAIADTGAWASFHAGRWAESVRRFEEAGRLHASAGLPLGEHYLEYSDVLRNLRLLGEAAEAARAAAAEFERHGARLMAAEARLRCAQLAMELGDPAAAMADAEAAAWDFRRQLRPAWTARATVTAAQAQAARDGCSPLVLRRLRHAAATLERLGLRAEASYAHLAAGRAALALHRRAAARHALTLASDLAHGQSVLVRLRGQLARALLAEVERPGDVVGECARGLRLLASHRAALPSLELRVLAAGHGAELGELGLRALLPGASPGRIVGWMERTRTAALLRVESPAAGTDQDVVALRSVERELRSARLECGEEPPALLARQSALEAQIRRRSWTSDGAATHTAIPVTGAELRRALDEQWLAEYAMIDDRVLAVVLEPRRTRVIELGPAAPIRREIEAALFGLRRLLGGTRFAAAAMSATGQALDTLARQLIVPLGVPADVPLVVVPSARLAGVLWSPLHTAPVSVAPSGTLWTRARARKQTAARTATSNRVALVAGPELPFAVDEVRAVAAQHQHVATLLPPDSTVDATIDLIKQADLAHLACHGRYRSDSPLFSSLDLSDGPLSLYEMLARGAVPLRVVLASCNSGAQEPYDGNELLGFVGALMSHGSTGIVAADVPIPDGACANSMTALHEHLSAGDTLATAVWQARASLAAGGPAEYVARCALTAYGPG